MKIVYVAPSQIPSSTANSVQVMKVCQALTQLGHEVILLVPGIEPHSWDKLNQTYGIQAAFPIEWIPARAHLKKFDFTWQAISRAKKLGADVVYTRMVWAAWFAERRQLPVVIEMHEVPAGRLSPFLYKSINRSSRPHLTVFITRALQQQIELHLSIKHNFKDIYIAPDGVDLERYTHLPAPAAARQKLGLADQTTAVYTGGFYPGRGLEILFELAAAFPQVQFMWIGGQPQQVIEWQGRLTARRLTNVRLTGFISNAELPLYQACADILLMPYKQKVAGSSGGDIAAVTSPMKLFEYMACGRAILASELPVLHEVLNENNCLFYTPEDFTDMSKKFAALLADTITRNRLGSQALVDVQQYSWRARMLHLLAYLQKNILEEKA